MIIKFKHKYFVCFGLLLSLNAYEYVQNKCETEFKHKKL